MRERSLNLAYLYLLRVPLLGAVFLALFPLLSLHRGSAAYFLLHGIFDIAPLDLFRLRTGGAAGDHAGGGDFPRVP
jgi:hypothetical protein